MHCVVYRRISDKVGKVNYIYHNATIAEVKEQGEKIEIETIPVEPIVEGKIPVAMVDLVNKTIFYELKPFPIDMEKQVEVLKHENLNLKLAIAEIAENIEQYK